MTTEAFARRGVAAPRARAATPVSVADRPGPIDALTGLRFVAAFSVLVAHATNWLVSFEPPLGFTGYLSFGSALGMPLFFVLSGFVIHYNYGQSFRRGFASPTIDFFIARFARLYPLYLAAFVVYLAIHGLLRSMVGGNDLSILPRYLLLWQAWRLEYRGTTWFGHLALPVAWSISVEVFFYALYPCLALPLQRLRKLRVAALAFGLITLGFYTAIILCYRNFDALRVWGNVTFLVDADPQNALLGWLLNTGPFGRFWEFMLGAVVAQACLLLRDRPLGAIEARLGPPLVVLATLVIAGIYVMTQHNAFLAFCGAYPGGFAPLLGVLIFGCARYRSPVSRVLASRPMVALGDASYSTYLLHEFTLTQLRQPTTWLPSPGSVATWAMMMVIGIGLTLILSLGTYRVFEVPARSWTRRVLHRVKAAAPTLALPRRVPGWLAPSLAAAVIGGGVVAWNWPRTPAIDIVEASYGEGCPATLPAPYVNNFRKGNVTLQVKQYVSQHCRGAACDYPIDILNLGDPVHGCAKGFSLSYRCSGAGGATRTVAVPGEANLHTVRLDCR